MRKRSILKKRIYALVVVFTLILTSFTFAHSGRTDSSGGHRDNKNKSGLGSYHYHCGGNPPHLHNGGCPYSSPTPRATTSSSTNPAKKAASAPKQVQPEKQIDVIVNGLNLAESYAIQRDGRTIVSIRPICDVLGASLDWDKDTQTARGQRGDDTFELTMGSKMAKVNDQPVTLDVAGQVLDGKTLVPVRFIAESLGAEVSFDSSGGAVIITASN